MDIVFIFILWLSAVCIIYTYFLYPLALSLLSILIKKPFKKDNIEPNVSMIIAAYNEEKSVKAKIEESLSLDYPKDKLEIIVASDCSSDDTDKIVTSFKDRGVILVRQERRMGKTSAQNKAATVAKGEILLFSDATTNFRQDVIRKIVRNFADDKVGCVGAELEYVNRNTSEIGLSRGIYWRYEKLLRNLESSLNSLLGVSGCCYAVRKKIYKKLANFLISDFVITWIAYEQGYSSVFEPEAIVYEDVIESRQSEIKMRIRVSSRSLVALRVMRRFLNPFRFGFFSFQLISHKLLRYLVPIFMIACFVSNIFLLEYTFYRVTLILQLIFYMMGLFTWKHKAIFSPIRYFLILNYSALLGIFKSFDADASEVWQPIRES